ncbi:MAG TPA: hypothetical protein VMM93_05065 [Vicinamibacterales bacterium]|nr:hypothetical protein [Vicinamibacterales bacterium]
MTGLGRLVAVCAVVALSWPALGIAQAQSLGTVRITRAVLANGEALAAGTYAVRLSDAAVSAVVGQSPDGARWVEFLQSGQARGRELATVLAGEAVVEVAGRGGPASGASRVELLKGGDFLRVWINRAGTHYLVHLSIPPAR